MQAYGHSTDAAFLCSQYDTTSTIQLRTACALSTCCLEEPCVCRFEVEEHVPILYVYEVQLEQRVQQKGLGAFLMMFLKLYSKKNQLERIMLTVMDVSSTIQSSVCDNVNLSPCIDLADSDAGKRKCSQDVHKAWLQARPLLPITGRPCWAP